MVNAGSAGFDRFTRQLKQFRPQEPAEERRLAILYRDTGDAAAARKLVEGQLGLVVKIAQRSRYGSTALADLVQEGTLGLMKALTKFDPDRGVRLSTYAAWWIRAYIHQYNMTNGRMVRVVTTLPQRKLFYALRKEQAKLNAAGQPADAQALAKKLNVPEKDVIEMELRLGGREVFLDVDGGTDANRAGATDLAESRPGPEETVAARELQRAVSDKMQAVEMSLGEREKLILNQRLIADDRLTLQEIGARFGISRERARQLEERLKKHLHAQLVGLADLAGDSSGDVARAA
jgi:RNA polymerase sigma-32 factor